MFVKICGLTTPDEAAAAAEAGADAIGFVFARSPRYVTPSQARAISMSLPSNVLRVGVFVSPEPVKLERIMSDERLDLAQIHGDFPAEGWRRLGDRAIRGLRVGRDEPSRELILGQPRFLLLDSYQPGLAGGTGITFPWKLAADYRRLGLPLLLSGGLNPGNIRAALDAVHPSGVDVSSGVETSPGHKDLGLVKAFIQAVRDWEEDNLHHNQ